MELKKTANPPAVSSPRPNVRVLALAPPDEGAASSGRRDGALWNSFFARMLLSLLAVAIPFLIVAGRVPGALCSVGGGAPARRRRPLFRRPALGARAIVPRLVD